VKNGVTGRVQSGLRVTELQRTPTEGSYQRSLFREFFFIYNVCQGRAVREVISGHFSESFSSSTMYVRVGQPSKKTWEILGYGFQDLESQLWGLDFHTRGFQDQNLKTFRT
jgi:hypothetical protein